MNTEEGQLTQGRDWGGDSGEDIKELAGVRQGEQGRAFYPEGTAQAKAQRCEE